MVEQATCPLAWLYADKTTAEWRIHKVNTAHIFVVFDEQQVDIEWFPSPYSFYYIAQRFSCVWPSGEIYGFTPANDDAIFTTLLSFHATVVTSIPWNVPTDSSQSPRLWNFCSNLHSGSRGRRTVPSFFSQIHNQRKRCVIIFEIYGMIYEPRNRVTQS